MTSVPGPAEKPRFGYTKSGRPVYAQAVNHLPGHTTVARFNRWLAVKITDGVGTMWCAYAFAVIALISLPQTLQQTFAHRHFSPQPLVQWVAQTFLQLVLLSIILVGQNIGAQASDTRSEKTFEDTETIIDRLDVHTEGGIQVLAERIDTLGQRLDTLAAASSGEGHSG